MEQTIEKIKAVIERLKDSIIEGEITSGRYMLCKMLDFINSLTEESKFKVGDEIVPKNGRESSLTITKVTDTEYYSKDLLICRIKEQDDWKLAEEPVSKELEEAAVEYGEKQYLRKEPDYLPDRCRGCYAPLVNAFKAGAMWQRNHVWHEARKDVIEKACEWLTNHNDYICGGTDGVSFFDMTQLVKDFKKALEDKV